MRIATLVLALSIAGCSGGGSHYVPPSGCANLTLCINACGINQTCIAMCNASKDMLCGTTSRDMALQSIHDMAMQNQTPPDLTMGQQFGTQKCYDLYRGCYLNPDPAIGCVDNQNNLDPVCVDTCNKQAKNQKTITDAEALVNCVLNAFTGVCSGNCSQPGDAGVDLCRNCLYGSCTTVNGALSCQGGRCSQQIVTCYNDK